MEVNEDGGDALEGINLLLDKLLEVIVHYYIYKINAFCFILGSTWNGFILLYNINSTYSMLWMW